MWHSLLRICRLIIFGSRAEEAYKDVLCDAVLVLLVETSLKGGLVKGRDGKATVVVDPGEQLVGADIVLLVLVNLVVERLSVELQLLFLFLELCISRNHRVKQPRHCLHLRLLEGLALLKGQVTHGALSASFVLGRSWGHELDELTHVDGSILVVISDVND